MLKINKYIHHCWLGCNIIIYISETFQKSTLFNLYLNVHGKDDDVAKTNTEMMKIIGNV